MKSRPPWANIGEFFNSFEYASLRPTPAMIGGCFLVRSTEEIVNIREAGEHADHCSSLCYKTGALDENRTRDLFFTNEEIAGTTARFRVYRRLCLSLIISLN